MKKGTQIAYIPHYAHGDIHHPDAEFGFVMSERINNHFCRYWRKGHLAVLRTIANSECTPTETLIEYKSVDQDIVDGWVERIEAAFTPSPTDEE
jgi:hypothetical protein